MADIRNTQRAATNVPSTQKIAVRKAEVLPSRIWLQRSH